MKFFEIRAMYEMLFSRTALHFVRTLQESYKEKIKDALRNLKENPFSYPYKKIKGKTNVYRIRVGKHRVLYKVNEKRRIVKNSEKNSLQVGNLMEGCISQSFFCKPLLMRTHYRCYDRFSYNGINTYHFCCPIRFSTRILGY